MGHLLESYHLLSYESLDSTNEEAKRLAHGGVGHGAVLWAKRQTQGRGRYGREWASLEGNLFVSLLLSPAVAREAFAQLSFVAALAMHDAVVPLLPESEKLTLKWPNDLMLNGKKVGGILLESFTTEASESRAAMPWVVVGAGLNIDQCPTQTDLPATHLKAAGVEIVSAKIVLSRFIHHFMLRYDQWEAEGFEPLRADWSARAHAVGSPLKARLADGTFEGSFAGLGPQGECLVTLADGSVRSVLAGDVFEPARG